MKSQGLFLQAGARYGKRNELRRRELEIFFVCFGSNLCFPSSPLSLYAYQSKKVCSRDDAPMLVQRTFPKIDVYSVLSKVVDKYVGLQ